MRRVFLRAMIVGVLGLAMGVASRAAASKTCVGEVRAVDVAGTGYVNAIIVGTSVNLLSPVLCNLNDQEGQYTPEACKVLVTLLTASQLAGKQVSLWFSDDQYNCEASWGYARTHGFYHARMHD